MRRPLALAAALVIASAAAWPIVRPPKSTPHDPLLVNDVSGLNPIQVAAVLQPTTTQEIARAVSQHAGPISIGGARFSMGGQIATAGALHVDMRGFNRILEFAPADKLITVQAGATWRQLQEHIDPANLSIAIMQSYANFTVGGSLSVNAHGRYVGAGPIIQSVRRIRLVLADGRIVEASPDQNSDVFYAAIGGYGGIGIITEATLTLADNTRLVRTNDVVRARDYPALVQKVGSDSSAVLHNADLYPGDYDTLRSVTFSTTTSPVTITDRLRSGHGSRMSDRLAYWILSEVPYGQTLRRYLADPLAFSASPIVWRNYEASYDATALEPASRERSTYLLQEFFVPVAAFEAFLRRLRSVLQKEEPNVLNISIRHATPDPGSLLAWARGEVFAFVLYYKQDRDAASEPAESRWIQELTEAALDEGGTFYLPYRLHATPTQFRRGYPRAGEFVALKRRVDPTNKFRNELWKKYGG